jgi:hypothetical protein
MASDDFLIFVIYTKELTYTLRNVAVAGSVEAITTYAVFFIQFIRRAYI